MAHALLGIQLLMCRPTEQAPNLETAPSPAHAVTRRVMCVI